MPWGRKIPGCPEPANDPPPPKRDLQYTTFCVNGDEYTGEWKDNKKNGKGTYRYKKTGKIYDGDWKDDFRDGFGTVSVKNKDGTYRKQYVGGFKCGKKHGFGTHFYTELVMYEGEWWGGMRHGWGRMIYADCSIYEGEWESDKQSGVGMTRYANGQRYEGYYKNGKKEGPGKYFYTDKGQVYEGVWVDDVAKCGAMMDHNRESVPDATPCPIPVCALSNPDAVLEEARKQFLPDDVIDDQ